VRATLATVALLLASLTAPVAACGRDEPQVPPGQLRIATGSSVGVYYRYGEALKELVAQRIPQLRPSVLETAASVANVEMIAGGAAEVAFTQADIASDAYQDGRPLLALARLYDDYLHLVVPAKSPVEHVADLRGKHVAVGAPGSGTLVTARRLLAVAGLQEERDFVAHRLNLEESVAALRSGRVDAFFFNGGLPVDAIQQLAAVLSIKLVDLSEHIKDLRRTHPSFYAEHAVPQSTYGLPKPISTIGVPNFLVVPATMPEATAYALTRVLFEGRDAIARSHRAGHRLNAREAINTDPLPLHPGAARYFRETKG